MVKPLNKGTKARLRRVAQAADKAADFLTKAHGETYNLPDYTVMIQNALQLVLQIQTLASRDAKAADPDNPPVEVKSTKADLEEVIETSRKAVDRSLG